jgi:hypothetical protein
MQDTCANLGTALAGEATAPRFPLSTRVKPGHLVTNRDIFDGNDLPVIPNERREVEPYIRIARMVGCSKI